MMNNNKTLPLGNFKDPTYKAGRVPRPQKIQLPLRGGDYCDQGFLLSIYRHEDIHWRDQQLKWMANVANSIKLRYPPQQNMKFASQEEKRQRWRKLELAKEVEKMIEAKYVLLRILYPQQDQSLYRQRVLKLTLQEKIWQTFYFFHISQFGRNYSRQQKYRIQLEQAMLTHQLSDIFSHIKSLILAKKEYNYLWKIDWHRFRNTQFQQFLDLFHVRLAAFMIENKTGPLFFEHVTGFGLHSAYHPKLIYTFMQWSSNQWRNGRIYSCSGYNSGSFIVCHQLSSNTLRY